MRKTWLTPSASMLLRPALAGRRKRDEGLGALALAHEATFALDK